MCKFAALSSNNFKNIFSNLEILRLNVQFLFISIGTAYKRKLFNWPNY